MPNIIPILGKKPRGHLLSEECKEGDEHKSLLSAMLDSPTYQSVEIDETAVKKCSFSTLSCNTSLSSVVPATTDPVTLTWRNLNVHGKQSRSLIERLVYRKDKHINKWTHILKDVNGIVKSGQLVALMGASGAGKTILLNTLTQRNVRGFKVEGDILVNGLSIGRDIANISAYVQQEDLFIGAFTVKEHLTFQALLRLPKTLSKADKLRRVTEVLQELGLKSCADTMIGIRGQGRGISGGEAKRLAFASEILTNPRLLFCDEPTTGLDSFMAENLVSVLSSIAARGRTILCTIHQPPSEVFAKFNSVMLLAEGRLAFYGDPVKALQFFETEGFPCPNDYNPADYFIQRLAIVPGNEEKCREIVTNLCDGYASSAIWRKYEEKIETYALGNSENKDIGAPKSNAVPWINQFTALLWRANLTGWRNRRISVSRIGQKIFMAIFIGLLYLRTPLGQVAISNINGALYFMLMQLTMSSIMTQLRALPTDFPVLTREHHSGIYGVLPYYLSKVLASLPLFAIDGIVFMTISFWMIGLHPTAISFFGTVGVGILVEEVSCSFGTMLSIVAPSFPVALTISGPALTVLQITGGLFANVGTLPVYITWITYLSWWKLGFELLACLQWGNITDIPCDREMSNLTCVTTGKQVLDSLSFSTDNIPLDIGLLFALFIGLYFIGGVALKIRAYKSR